MSSDVWLYRKRTAIAVQAWCKHGTVGNSQEYAQANLSHAAHRSDASDASRCYLLSPLDSTTLQHVSNRQCLVLNIPATPASTCRENLSFAHTDSRLTPERANSHYSRPATVKSTVCQASGHPRGQ